MFDLYTLILCPGTLQNAFIVCVGFLIDSFGFSRLSPKKK